MSPYPAGRWQHTKRPRSREDGLFAPVLCSSAPVSAVARKPRRLPRHESHGGRLTMPGGGVTVPALRVVASGTARVMRSQFAATARPAEMHHAHRRRPAMYCAEVTVVAGRGDESRPARERGAGVRRERRWSADADRREPVGGRLRQAFHRVMAAITGPCDASPPSVALLRRVPRPPQSGLPGWPASCLPAGGCV